MLPCSNTVTDRYTCAKNLHRLVWSIDTGVKVKVKVKAKAIPPIHEQKIHATRVATKEVLVLVVLGCWLYCSASTSA